MKKVSVVIPTYNEEINIPLVHEEVSRIFRTELPEYDYSIQFIDNCSTDSSREKIKELAAKDSHVQYIFNVKNFGFSRSTFYGLTQADGDCAILLFADMQDPPAVIPEFVREWEKGSKMVVGIKNKSAENPLMYLVRKFYYSFVDKITSIEHIKQFDGFGLYDKSVIETFGKLNDPLPYLRGIVSELAPSCKRVFYEQKTREHGKSSFNFSRLYDVAMLGITSYSKTAMRTATFTGIFITMVSFVIAIVTFFLKLFKIVEYPVGSAAILFGVFFLGGVQLAFLGIIGEYISNMNIRIMNRPLVVEDSRHGFKEKP